MVQLKPHGYSYVYHAKAVARSTGVASKFYTLRDIYESYFDVYTGYPIMAIRNIHEKNYKRYNELRFDRERNVVFSIKSGEKKTIPGILDILSSYYFARTFLFRGLKKNQVITLPTYFDDDFFPVEIRYKGKRKIKTNFGRVECLRFAPVINENSPFEKEKDLTIWFTNDGNYIPVEIELDLPVGSAKFKLIRYSGLVNPFGKKKTDK